MSMTRHSLFSRTIADHRGAIIGLGLTDALIAVIVTVIFPSYRSALASFQFPDALKGFLGEAGQAGYSTFNGFITVEFFSWVPILLIILAIITGTAIVAGDEAAGTLDLVLAQPVSRSRLLRERGAGLAVALAIAALASLPGFLLASLMVDFSIDLPRIALAVVCMLPIALLFLALSILGSAALPSRSAATLLAVGVAVSTYFFNLIGAAVESVRFLQKLSPFYWADSYHVLSRGFDWQRTGVFLLLAAALFGLALLAFERRDVAAGVREWHAGAWLRARFGKRAASITGHGARGSA
jgi:ABC-2 type transport system permease protein